MSPSPNAQPVLLATSQRVAAGIFAGLFLALAVAAAAYGLLELVSAAKEILVSVITGSASLLSIVCGYAFQRAKDVELAAIQRRRELEAAERKSKQENYARVLERLAPYIRTPEKEMDAFTTAYLYTWVTGSVAVVQAVHAFLKSQEPRTLDALLHAMRDDLTLEEPGSALALRSLNSNELFSSPTPLRGLGSGVGRNTTVANPMKP